MDKATNYYIEIDSETNFDICQNKIDELEGYILELKKRLV
jgi:prefoldin subunit 5